ncbi:MAG: PBECR2 nuclease fold domain-containing protein [Lentisphaeria bacterium]|nr:PBECR2 nuclease fold domain-containing protein [Lentisphaeria bacterium]
MARKGKSFSREESHVTREEPDEYQKSAIEQGYSRVSEWAREKMPPVPPDTDAEKARKEIEDGFSVQTKSGEEIHFSEEIIRHWESEKGYDERQVNGRLKRLEMARETVRDPEEIWFQGTQTAYVQLFRKSTGGLRGCVVFVHGTNVVKTYFPKDARELEKVRKGIKMK